MANVFLSYRRDGGEALAEILYTKLTERGYDVFYDKESLKSGLFEPKLYAEIEQCNDFVLILPPGGLDRCLQNEDDWVRCEIRHAIVHGKNIVPIIMRGFSFPPVLPNDIRDVSRSNGVPFENMEFIDARVDRITELMVTPRGNRRSASKSRKGYGSRGRRKSILCSQIKRGLARKILWMWRHPLVWVSILLCLAVGILDASIDLSRDRSNINVDQWISPRCLFYRNPYVTNVALSADGTQYAYPEDDGSIKIRQILDNVSAPSPVMTLHTSFAGRQVACFFTENRDHVYVFSDNAFELFSTHTGELIRAHTFPKPDEAWEVVSIWLDDRSPAEGKNMAILWGDPANYSYTCCTIYDIAEDYAETTSLSLEGLIHVATADNRYMLFSDSLQNFRVIDLIEGGFVAEEALQTVLANNVCGRIDDDGYTIPRMVDRTGRYLVHTIPKTGEYEGFYDVLIYDMLEGRDVFSRTYILPTFFSFAEDGQFVILCANFNSSGHLELSLRQVSYLEVTAPEEVILTEGEINRLFQTDSLVEENYYDIRLLEGTDKALVVCNNRMQLIDLSAKRRIASSNPLISEEDAALLQNTVIYESNQNLLVSLVSASEDDPKATEQSLFRFSYTEENGDILIREDAYAEEATVDPALMLVLWLSLLTAFTVSGAVLVHRDNCDRRGREDRNSADGNRL